MLMAACAHTFSTTDILQHYGDTGDRPRMLAASEYIAWFKRQRWYRGELDRVPETAIIVHDVRARVLLSFLPSSCQSTGMVTLGTTDPSELHMAWCGAHSILVTSGLPGAGGIATQVAELAALGVKRVVHIGSAGLLGPTIPDSTLVVSRGSVKDGAAILLSGGKGRGGPIALGDSALADQLDHALEQAGLKHARGMGATIPVFYDQPESYIRWLLSGREFDASTRPSYVEMEEAPFFEQAHLSGVAAASIVVGSDRYALAGDSLNHRFTELDQFEMEIEASRAAILALTGIQLKQHASDRN